MSFPWKIVAAGGLALGAIGGAIHWLGERETKPSAPKRVALIGDSYAVGLGPELGKIFPVFRYAGVVGTTAWQWANRNAACGDCGDWLMAFKPDVVLVSLGVNDGKAANNGHFQTIVRELHGIGARVVWIEPPAAVDTPAIRKTLASLGVETVPPTNTPLAADGLHPKSYAPWAHEVAEAVFRA